MRLRTLFFLSAATEPKTLLPAVAAAACAAVRHLRQDTSLRAAQQKQAARLKERARAADIPILEGDTHIVPVMVGDAAATMRISQLLLDQHGIYVQPINYPTVPVGSERLRLTPGPLHTDAMIDHLVGSLQKAFALAGDAQAQQTG